MLQKSFSYITPVTAITPQSHKLLSSKTFEKFTFYLITPISSPLSYESLQWVSKPKVDLALFNNRIAEDDEFNEERIHFMNQLKEKQDKISILELSCQKLQETIKKSNLSSSQSNNYKYSERLLSQANLSAINNKTLMTLNNNNATNNMEMISNREDTLNQKLTNKINKQDEEIIKLQSELNKKINENKSLKEQLAKTVTTNKIEDFCEEPSDFKDFVKIINTEKSGQGSERENTNFDEDLMYKDLYVKENAKIVRLNELMQNLVKNIKTDGSSKVILEDMNKILGISANENGNISKSSDKKKKGLFGKLFKK